MISKCRVVWYIVELEMKILYLASTNTAESGNRVLLSWIDWFSQHGHELGACCPPEGTLSKELLNRLGKNYKELNFETSTKNLLSSMLGLFLFTLRFKPDIIHCNTEICYIVARYVARLLGVPIVLHVRYHFNSSFYQWLFRNAFLPQKILFVSKALLLEELSKLPECISHDKLTVLHNCINEPSLKNEKAVNKEKNILLACYGCIQRLKNQEAAIYLANLFRLHKMPVKIIIAGRTKEMEYYKKLQKLCDEYTLANYIDFLGHVNDVFNLINKTFCTISVSKYETFGISIIESMALGVPVVAFEVPAIKEILGDCGIVVKQGDVNALFEACNTLIRGKQLYNLLQKRAQNRFRNFFHPDVLCPKLEGIYHQILLK